MTEQLPVIDMQAEPAVFPTESNDISMSDTQGADSSAGQGNLLGIIYPCLGPPPSRWQEDLAYLSENLGRSYITDMDTKFTKEACQRLPSLVDTMVQSISRLSGCLMSAQTISHDYENRSTVKAYSMLTNSIRHCWDVDDARADMSNFMHSAFQNIGQGFEREPFHVYPMIYSSPFWCGRPVLPPKHPGVEQRRWHLIDWLGASQVWQGQEEMSMDTLAARVASGHPPPFAPSRMPANLLWHIELAQWSEAHVDLLYDWVYNHQERIIAGDLDAELTAPQFMEDNAEEPYRKDGHIVADSYNEHSAYYFQVMQHFRFDKGVYLPRIVKNPRWFTLAVLLELQYLLTPEVQHLLDLVKQNQLMSPPERTIDPSDPPLLMLMPTSDCDLVLFFNSLNFPIAAYMWNNSSYNLYNILSLWRFVGVRRALVQDGKVAGGVTGAFQAAMTLLAFLKLKHELKSGRIPLSQGVINWGPTEDEQIKQIALTLSKQIQDSFDLTTRPLIHQGIVFDPWIPSRVTFQAATSEEKIDYDWPYNGFGHSNSPRETTQDVDDQDGDKNTAKGPTDTAAGPQQLVLDLTTPSPVTSQEVDMYDAMVLSPPPAPTPAEAVATAGSVPDPESGSTAVTKSPADMAFAEAPSFATDVVGPDSDDGNPWEPYRAKLEDDSMQQSVPTGTTEPANEASVSRNIVRPSTEKLRSNDLPETSDAASVRRLRSLGPLHPSQTVTQPSGNTLGLSASGASSSFGTGSAPGSTDIGFPLFTSTPQAATQQTTRVSSASGLARPQPRSSAAAHMPSIDAGPAGRTVTESMDVEVGSSSQLEPGLSSTDQAQAPAISTALTRRMVTRHAAREVALKRSQPKEGLSSLKTAPKKSKSHERNRNKK